MSRLLIIYQQKVLGSSINDNLILNFLESVFMSKVLQGKALQNWKAIKLINFAIRINDSNRD